MVDEKGGMRAAWTAVSTVLWQAVSRADRMVAGAAEKMERERVARRAAWKAFLTVVMRAFHSGCGWDALWGAC